MSVWTNISKTAASWVNMVKNAVRDFLLKEDGFYLLLETGDKIILENSTGWINQAKN